MLLAFTDFQKVGIKTLEKTLITNLDLALSSHITDYLLGNIKCGAKNSTICR